MSLPNEEYQLHPFMKYTWAMARALQLHYKCNRQDLALKTGISQAVISKILNGYLATVSLETVARLEAAMDIMIEETKEQV